MFVVKSIVIQIKGQSRDLSMEGTPSRFKGLQKHIFFYFFQRFAGALKIEILAKDNNKCSQI
jgi:hypothetical protein